MLDADTKRRIDTARDILVGKVPDPKSQVEQITIALIYKFMDDMDAESEELGGARKFFTGEFVRYGWAKLMRSGLGGHETLNLYAEAIDRMPENPGIPLLFRNIFQNAYLPYRDPETLRAFLKVIDEFSYDHSERLGDAFEYLLSVLGSQGDAGQFRTPRHIIDFIVAVIDPKKDEAVLDPACGTAGFLISSYKHIVAANTGDDGSTLTPEEKGRLAANFKGYDISPDMVRLSLANMYLHDFVDPHIFEYDTLTSEERWNDRADVILANPPFMSPKGGIRPHNRFSIRSKRSEVLFVDYMAEHLTPAGRAGIIVPEGVIFQSQNAHTQLRKMLVEEYLVAVVSLPAGVFKPYSGVKTSILILDKALARRTDRIAFFKVENDGFDLGDQRRPIAKDDLPQAQAEIGEYLRRARAGESMDGFELTIGLVVEKSKIAANGDYNLSGERYRESEGRLSQWASVRVGDVFRTSGESVSPETLSGPVTYIGLQDIMKDVGQLAGDVVTGNPAEIKSLKNVFKNEDILYGKLRPNLNKVWLADRNGICSTDILVIRPLDERVASSLYVHVFRSSSFNHAVLGQLRGAQLPRVSWQALADLEIPLPPLEVQQELVAEIEGYQRVIDGARAVVDNYRPHVEVDPAWPMVALGEVCELVRGVTYSKNDEVGEGGHQVLRANNILKNTSTLDLSEIKRVSDAVKFSDNKKLRACDIFICMASGSKDHIGKVAFISSDTDYHFGGFMGAVRVKPVPIEPAYLFQQLRHNNFNDFLRRKISGANINNLNAKLFYQFRIPLPPLATQQAIVAEIEAERALVTGNRQLIERFEKKIENVVARVWGEGAQSQTATSSAG